MRAGLNIDGTYSPGACLILSPVQQPTQREHVRKCIINVAFELRENKSAKFKNFLKENYLNVLIIIVTFC